MFNPKTLENPYHLISKKAASDALSFDVKFGISSIQIHSITPWKNIFTHSIVTCHLMLLDHLPNRLKQYIYINIRCV